jgi:hypothetical protein
MLDFSCRLKKIIANDVSMLLFQLDLLEMMLPGLCSPP